MNCVREIKMKRVIWIGAALTACALVGCGPQSTKTTASNQGSQNTPGITGTSGGTTGGPETTATAGTPGTNTDPGTKTETPGSDANKPLDPNKLSPKDMEAIKPIVPPIKIAPKGTEGWQKEEITPAVVGDKMDKSLANLKSALGFVSVSFDIPKVGKLTGKGRIGIENQKTYYADYFTPETKSAAIRVVSNGNERMELTPTGWEKLSDVPGTATFNDEKTAEWKSKFWTEMMDNYRLGRASWKPIMEAWQAGKAGYTSTIETKTITVSGAKHKIHRIISKSKKDSDTEIEVVVDAEKYLPVAVRVVDKLPDGTVNKSMWSVIWAFGGKHDPKFFKLPKV